MTEHAMSEHGGFTVISATELLDACKRLEPGAADLADVDDAIVGEAAKEALAVPDLPRAVRAL